MEGIRDPWNRFGKCRIGQDDSIENAWWNNMEKDDGIENA